MYIRLLDLKYPCTLEDVGSDNPHVAIPSTISDQELNQFGYATVESTPPPIVDGSAQIVKEGLPTLVGSTYKQEWIVEDLPADVIQRNSLDREKQDRIIAVNAAQTLMDSTAQSRGYDSALSCVSYSGDEHPIFGLEGSSFKRWRSTVWDYCYKVEAEVASGGVRPSIEEFIGGIPKMVWPS